MTAKIDARDGLLTVVQVRREFFDEKARPSKAEVERWIVSGVAEGVRLRAVKIDGRFFVRRRDVEIFLQKLEVAPPDRVERRETADANRTEIALERLRRRGMKV